MELFRSLVMMITLVSVSGALDNKGTEFILGFIPNFSGSSNVELQLTGDFATTVNIEYPLGTTITTAEVTPGNVTIVELPVAAAVWVADEVTPNLVRATAPAEFVTYMINRRDATTDAALGLPVDTMNTEYVVMDYTGPNGRSEFLVYAAFDATTVTITPNIALVGREAGTPFEVQLNRGEGYLAQSATSSSTDSLTGSIVSASRPVGMTNGHQCANIPPFITACDHIFEVAQPVQTWGIEVGVANLPQRTQGSIYRVVVSEDNTVVTIDNGELATLSKGEFFETEPLPGNHVFRGDKPIYVAQYMTGISSPGATGGDPAQGNMIPFAQYLTDYTFSTVGGSQFMTNYVTIIANNDDVGSLELDGTPVAADQFEPIPTSDFSVALVEIPEGAHSTSSANPHGITVEGYDSADSYLYPGGALFQFINPINDLDAPIVTLESQTGSPPTVSGLAEDNRPTDTGIFFIELGPNSTNLELTVDAFVPGDGSVGFVVSLIDASSDGSGTVVVTDGAGNVSTVPVTISLATPGPTPGPTREPIGDQPTREPTAGKPTTKPTADKDNGKRKGKKKSSERPKGKGKGGYKPTHEPTYEPTHEPTTRDAMSLRTSQHKSQRQSHTRANTEPTPESTQE